MLHGGGEFVFLWGIFFQVFNRFRYHPRREFNSWILHPWNTKSGLYFGWYELEKWRQFSDQSFYRVRSHFPWTCICHSWQFPSVPFGVKDKDKLKSHGTIFTPIPVRIVTYDEEKAASKSEKMSPGLLRKSSNWSLLVDLFQGGKFSKNFQVKPPGELDQVQHALEKLLFMIKHLIGYVDNILVRHSDLCVTLFHHSIFFFNLVQRKSLGS